MINKSEKLLATALSEAIFVKHSSLEAVLLMIDNYMEDKAYGPRDTKVFIEKVMAAVVESVVEDDIITDFEEMVMRQICAAYGLTWADLAPESRVLLYKAVRE